MVKLYSPFLVAYKLQADSNAKLLFVVYVGFQVTLLLLSGIPVSGITRAYISLKIGGYTFLLGISFIEHMRSVRPSTLLIVYLGASIASDLLRVRVLFIFPHTHVFGRVLPASFFTRTMIFALEIIEKRSLLLDQWKDVSAEATGSVLNRALFFWLNNLFLRGYRTLLTVETLPSLDGELLSASDPTKLIDRWKHGMLLFPYNNNNTYNSHQPIRPVEIVFSGPLCRIIGGPFLLAFYRDLPALALLSYNPFLFSESSTTQRKRRLRILIIPLTC